MRTFFLSPTRMTLFGFWLWSLFGLASTRGDAIIDFDELSTWTGPGATGSYYNGNHSNSTNSDGWTAGTAATAYFGNQYTDAWGGYWNGFAYSNVNDMVTSGHANQYAAITGTDFSGNGNYSVVFSGSHSYFNVPSGWRVGSVQLTNTTYAWHSMKHGDSYGKKFGGQSGNDADWLLVTLTGYRGLGGAGVSTGTVDFYLADFQFSDNSLDYLVDQWTHVDLTALGDAASVRLTFSGSDMGAFGLSTPAYVALDHLRLTAVPEPTGPLIGVVIAAWALVSRRRQCRCRVPTTL